MGSKLYTPLNTVLIDSRRLIANLTAIQSLIGTKNLMPVLKSNAYGHGIKEVYGIIRSQPHSMVCVDSIFEAYEIYKSNSHEKVLIMGYIDPSNLKFKQLPFSYSVWNLEQMKMILSYQNKAKFHLFVDTGMHREGISLNEIELFCKGLDTKLSSRIEGVMSHYASADDEMSYYHDAQTRNFKKAIEVLHKHKVEPKYIHMEASAATLRQLNDVCTDVRAGIDMYGISPLSGLKTKLEPVISLTSKIVQIHELAVGDRVGYNETFVAKKKMQVGVLPLGYNDGIDRRLSNAGFVKIGGKFCKILGRVSMNITTVDVTDVESAVIGTEVVVFSSDAGDQNSIENSAKICGTIPYELLVHIDPSIRRVTV